MALKKAKTPRRRTTKKRGASLRRKSTKRCGSRVVLIRGGDTNKNVAIGAGIAAIGATAAAAYYVNRLKKPKPDIIKKWYTEKFILDKKELEKFLNKIMKTDPRFKNEIIGKFENLDNQMSEAQLIKFKETLKTVETEYPAELTNSCTMKNSYLLIMINTKYNTFVYDPNHANDSAKKSEVQEEILYMFMVKRFIQHTQNC